MNTPNKLTVARMIATPIFMAAMAIDFPYHYLVALVLFAAAAITDAIDGNMARKHNLVTNFGKFLDPLADKMLTTAAFLGFLARGIGWQIVWICFIVLFREFLVSSVRLVLVSSGGGVVPANIWGKSKTMVQMCGIVMTLALYSLIDDFNLSAIQPIADIAINVVLWAGAVLCVISGVIYLWDAREYIDPSK
ncbi:MAG: CDP-diacylglycerol--glycerol-3-phosphate 3-phosphatidyltransferase [Clostridia bacterium]|nr:CDP-diacylglycerol--glycerol-3-phosphate 3-phosphatidyltransferase [Clostridia bacterium]